MKPSLPYQLVQAVVLDFDVGSVQYPAGSERSTQFSHQLAGPWYNLLATLKLIDWIRMRHSEPVSTGTKKYLCGLRVDICLMWQSHCTRFSTTVREIRYRDNTHHTNFLPTVGRVQQ
jgi:hypothetical protein